MGGSLHTQRHHAITRPIKQQDEISPCSCLGIIVSFDQLDEKGRCVRQGLVREAACLKSAPAV
jgi:hypothetical protein